MTVFAAPGSDVTLGARALQVRWPTISDTARADVSMSPEWWLQEHHAYLSLMLELRGAGLDVYDQEPLPAQHPLRSLDNVVLTPHLGYVTEGTYRMFFEDMVEDIEAWLIGSPLRLL